MDDDGRPTSALDNLTRLNLLDVVLEKARTLNRKSLINFLVIIGKLNPEQRFSHELADYFEKQWKSSSGNLQAMEAVSGLLLIYPNHFVNILEGSESILYEMLLLFAEKKPDVVSEAKVLAFVNNVPARLFSQWSYRILNLSSVRMDESQLQESIETKVSEALTFLVKLSKELATVSKLQFKAALDQLTTKYAHLILPQDLIEVLMKSKELVSIGEYGRRDKCPLDITLDYEVVWPVQEDLFMIDKVIL